jgi:general secretion pathway protein K
MKTAFKAKSAGVVLIGVLWLVALVAVLAVAAGAAGRGDARLAADLQAAAQARAAAEGAAQLAFFHLASAGERWQADGRVHELRLGEVAVRVRVSDESGRLDLNFAPRAALASLLGEAAAARIAALREQRRIESVAELQSLAELARKDYEALRWAFTVHSRQPGVLAQAASRRVLLALPDADEREVDAYLQERARHQEAGLEPPAPPAGLRRYLVRNGNGTAEIQVHARAASGAAARLSATVDLRRPGRDGPFRIVEWRNDAEALF